ncbi:MAG: hypothetical protein ABGX83_01590 [Nitrospira sp.]
MSRGRGQGRKGTKIALIFLLCSLFSFTGCLGESNTDPPTLPPGVTNISNNPGVSSSPSAATIGNTLYVVWAEGNDAGINEIFLARSDNGGISFKTFQVSNTGNFSGNPKMALSYNGTSNIVHVVWEEFLPAKAETDIFYGRAVEDVTGNLTFESPKNISISDPICGPSIEFGLPCPSQAPTITTFEGHVFVAWVESTFYVPPDPTFPGSTFKLFNSDILMVRSSDHGVSFPDPNLASPEILSLPNTGFGNEQSTSQNPSLAASNGHFFVAWEDTPPIDGTLPKIFFRSLEIASFVFNPSIASSGVSLSNAIVSSNLPGVAGGGDNVYVIWEGTDAQGGDSEIFLRRAEGVNLGPPFSFTAPINISNNAGRSKKGRIAVSGLDIFISWEDTSSGVPLVLLRDSVDGGVIFGDTQTLISSSNTIGNTAITASGNTLLTFWEDALFGNFEIFFFQPAILL